MSVAQLFLSPLAAADFAFFCWHLSTALYDNVGMGTRRWYSHAGRQKLKTDGVNDKWIIETQSVGSEGTMVHDDQPLLIANEWIAGRIAQYLGLPIPPFVLMKKPGEKGMFASLHYGLDTPPDDSNPLKCIEADIDLCTGILLFDILVANSDRHHKNLNVDDADDPKEITIFDHERAMFGALPGGDEFRRLNTLRDLLGVTGKFPTGGNRHFFLKAIPSSGYFYQWASWIFTIPDRFIRIVCGEMIGLGLFSVAHSQEAAEFLIHRKRNLIEIIRTHKHEFTSISNWGLIL